MTTFSIGVPVTATASQPGDTMQVSVLYMYMYSNMSCIENLHVVTGWLHAINTADMNERERFLSGHILLHIHVYTYIYISTAYLYVDLRTGMLFKYST